MTVLNIDDDPDDLALFCDALNSIDPKITCLTAQTPTEAFQLLDENETIPTYIFLDINMPIKNGKQCLKEIRKRPNLSKTPVVILTTSRYIPDKEEYEELGVSSFLNKGTAYFDLVRSIKKAINK